MLKSRDEGERPSSGQNLTFILINGAKLPGSAAEVWDVLTDRHSTLFFVIAAVIVGYLYPLEHVSHLEWWQKMVTITIAELLLLSILGLGLSILTFLSGRLSWLVLPVPVVLFTSLLIMEIMMQPVNLLLWDNPLSSRQEVIKIVVTNYIWLLCFEIIYSVFVFPNTRVGARSQHNETMGQRADSAVQSLDSAVEPMPFADHLALMQSALASPIEENGNKSKTLSVAQEFNENIANISGKKVNLEQTIMIKAEEHYIRIFTTEGEYLERFRISAAIAALPADAGFQVHRSIWVNVSFIVKVARVPNGKLLLTLHNNHTVVVPKARRKDFEDYLDRT